MGRPQQEELARSENTDLQPDHAETRIQAHGRRAPDEEDDRAGPVPAENRPGHHPEHEQDQPPPGAMAARLGVPPGRRARRLVARAVGLPFRWAAKALDAVAGALERFDGDRPHEPGETEAPTP